MLDKIVGVVATLFCLYSILKPGYGLTTLEKVFRWITGIGVIIIIWLLVFKVLL